MKLGDTNYKYVNLKSATFTATNATGKTKQNLTAHRVSVCRRRKSAFLDNVVCDLHLQTHDLENVIGVT